MKILTSTLLAFLFTNFCLAQETKTVTNNVAGFEEKYNVLKSDKKTKHGPFQLVNTYRGDLIMDGFYSNNQKDSIWHIYSSKHNVIAEGLYKNDHRYGVWTNYDGKGNVTNQYDFTANKNISHRNSAADTAQRYYVMTSTDTLYTRIDRAPLYLNGEEMIYRTIGKLLRFPERARNARVNGKVTIAFTVNEQGQTSNYRVSQGIGYGCDEEALRVVKLVPADWLPAIYKGKPASVVYTVPITYTAQ